MSRWFRRSPSSQPARPAAAQDPIDVLDSQADPWAAFVRNFAVGERNRKRVLLGVARDAGGVLQIEPGTNESNVLVIGPPKSSKTVGVFAPQILNHIGPRVVMSTKSDLARMTAVACSRMGPVWHLDASGENPIPGLIPARWSVVDTAPTWTKAQQLASRLTGSSADAERSRDPFWAKQAGDYLAPALYAANVGGVGIGLVLDAALDDRSAIQRLERILSTAPEGTQALRTWDAVRNTHPSGLSSILLSARDAVRIWNRPGVSAQSTTSNFDIDTFIRGEPGVVNLQAADAVARQMYNTTGAVQQGGWPAVGRYGTVFITASSAAAKEAQTIYRAFLRQLNESTAKLHDADKDDDVQGRRSTLLVIDELANLAPDPVYTEMVTQSAEQGLLISSGIQDLSQLEKHFGAESKGMLSIHRENLVFPGLNNKETLETISTLFGTRWETRESSGTSTNMGRDTSRGFSTNLSDHRLPVLEAGDVRRGAPGDRNAMLRIGPHHTQYLYPMPVYSARPWPRALITSLELQLEAQMTDSEGMDWPVSLMPVPDLGRSDEDGERWLIKTQRGGADLYQRYLRIRAEYAERRQHLGPAHAERVAIHNETMAAKAEIHRLQKRGARP